MKNALLCGLLSLASVSAFADTINSVAKRVHTSSAGKLIVVYGTLVEEADGTQANIDGTGGKITISANALCDLSKPWKATDSNQYPYLICIAK